MIGEDTPLIPEIVADSAVGRVLQWMDLNAAEAARVWSDREREISDAISAWAEERYAADRDFNRMVRGSGNGGRDGLLNSMVNRAFEMMEREFPGLRKVQANRV